MSSPPHAKMETVSSQSFVPFDPQLQQSPLGVATLAHAFCELICLAKQHEGSAQFTRIVAEAATEFAIAISFELFESLESKRPFTAIDLYWTHLALSHCRDHAALDRVTQKRLERAFHKALNFWDEARMTPAIERRTQPRPKAQQSILSQ